MLAKLVKYKGKENYKTRTPDSTTEMLDDKPLSVFTATELGKKKISKQRGLTDYVCYEVVDVRGKVRHKLPNQ